MIRRKLVIKRLAQANRRPASFAKMRSRLVKNARQLCTLSDAEVAVIVFSKSGKLFQFASTSMTQMLMRYQNYQHSSQAPLITSKAEVSHSSAMLKSYCFFIFIHVYCFYGYSSLIRE
ncbi:hypothetical protein EUTSA_v10017787mg [Eutrema salsugineum]|uniref:MADS-box domain-containing protein n=1 Tax=Eutrema salsugineum TaxID=72664 RepID=V4MFL6_EUTSA|nr:hypothetical protein EUTSA_v10017787mg [Eutrema salsugineum]